jgi:DnaJ family protein A protein 2
MHFGGDSPFSSFFGGGGGGAPQQRTRAPVNTSEYYTQLGIEKSASDTDIKKAYRKAAMKNHPDRGGDEDTFKQINEAYEVLSDPAKRKVYDLGGKDAVEQQDSGGGGQSAADMMSSMFGGGFGGGGARRASAPQKTRDAVHTLPVTLEECYTGKTRKLAITRNEVCTVCKGVGGKTGCETTCTDCNGHGAVLKTQQVGPGMIQQMQMTCTRCKGAGRSINLQLQCKTCNGKKVVQHRRILEVVVEKGVSTGHKIRFRGEADQHPTYESGDVVFMLKVREHPLFTRKGNHLFMTKTIPLYEALCGTTFTLPHLDGRLLSITSKPGEILSPGTCKEITDEGMPTQGNPFLKGKFVIKFSVEFPSQFSVEQRHALRKLLCPPSTKNTEVPIHNVDEHCVLQDFDDAAAAREYQSNRSAYDSDDEESHLPAGQNVQCAQG